MHAVDRNTNNPPRWGGVLGFMVNTNSDNTTNIAKLGGRASYAVTECVGLASSRSACHTKLMLSQAALTRSAPYSSTTGRTGAPARNAPVLNGSRHLPLVVVPCGAMLPGSLAPAAAWRSQEQECACAC